MFERLTDCIWRSHDAAGSTAYLIVGKTCAAMIDCGMVARPLMEEIRSITQLPVKLLLTHAHPDHYGAAAEFEEIWLHRADIAALPVFEKAFEIMRVAPLERSRLHAFDDGHVFDLGGRRIQACWLPGHTPGSSLFVCEEEACVFCGDAVGSGDIVLMSVPMAYDLAAYRRSLAGFMERSAPWEGYRWYSGHYHQAQRPDGEAPNEPCRALVGDMIALCDALLMGRLQGEATRELFAPGGAARRAYMGRAGIVYSDEQLACGIKG